MIIAIPDDYQLLAATLDCYAQLAGHEVRIFQGPARDDDELVRQLNDAEAVVLIRERTAITRDLLGRLPRLRHIAQTGRSTHHIDVAACTARGITVSTVTGAIDLGVRVGVNATLVVRGMSGRFQNDLAGTEPSEDIGQDHRAVLGSGSGKIEIDRVAGNLRIHG